MEDHKNQKNEDREQQNVKNQGKKGQEKKDEKDKDEKKNLNDNISFYHFFLCGLHPSLPSYLSISRISNLNEIQEGAGRKREECTARKTQKNLL